MSKVNKTIMIFDQHGLGPIQFLVVEGDYSHLSQVYVNISNDKLADELINLVYDQQGYMRKDIPSFEKFPCDFGDEIKNGTCAVIVCGFPP